MPTRWDDIEILQAIDRHQEQSAGAALWHVNGLQLMEELAGGPVGEEHRWRGFVQELCNARDAGLLTFQVDRCYWRDWLKTENKRAAALIWDGLVRAGRMRAS